MSIFSESKISMDGHSIIPLKIIFLLHCNIKLSCKKNMEIRKISDDWVEVIPEILSLNEEYQSITAEEILEMNIENFPTLLENVFPMYGMAALCGSSDLGKSYLLQQFSVAIVTNAESFLGFKLNVNNSSVIYISTEDDIYTMSTRLRHFRNQTDGKPLENLRFMFNSENLEEDLKEELEKKPVSLVIIDTFADVFTGSLNDSISVRKFLNKYKAIAYEYKCLIVFNHHCSKHNDNRPPSKDNVMGSQGFESKVRTVIELRNDYQDENKRHFCIVKGNHIKNEFKNASFELNYDFENGFEATGNRVPFSKLYTPKFTDNNLEIERKVITLFKAGKSYREIADELTKQGHPIGKSKVGDIINRCCPSEKSS